MDINIYRTNNNLYIDIQGRVVLDYCEQLKNAAISLIDKGINQVYVDLSSVDFIDSAGLGVLVGLKMTANKNKARVVLISPSNSVSDILFVSKLQSIFDILTGSEAELLRRTLVVKEYLIKHLGADEPGAARKTPVRTAGPTEEVIPKKPTTSTPPIAASPTSTAPSPGIRPSTAAPPYPPKAEPASASAAPSAVAGRSTKDQVDEFCRKAVELMRQGDYEKAVEHYLEAIKTDPEFLPAYNNLAIVYEKRPSWRAKAIETWEKVLELSQSVGDQKHIDRAQKHLSNLKTSF